MLFVTKSTIAMLIAGLVLSPAGAEAQSALAGAANQSAGTTTPGNEPGQLTGKERLGEKWKDEQRIDNCKVPPDKRGIKPRPSSCAHAPLTASSPRRP